MEVWWSIKRSEEPTIPNPVDSVRYTQKLNSHLAPCRPIPTLADSMDVESLEMNEERDNLILEADKHALFEFVEVYSQSSWMTLEYCASLKRWLQKERDLQQGALKDLSSGQTEKYERRLNELRRCFRETGGTFTVEISTKFHVMYTQQIKTIKMLQQQKQKFHKKLKFAKAWKKLSRAIFVSVFAAVMVCSIVAVVLASPLVSAAVAMATALPLGSFGKWIDSRLKKLEEALKRKMEAVGVMLAGSRITINDLECINAIIDELDVHINSLLLNPQSVITQDEGVQIVKMMEEFMTSMNELADQAERYRTSTKRASNVVLQRIIKTSS